MVIEVFKAGTHTDASGKTRNWSESDLDQIASSYDPKYHEAPVVIGHPKNNAPAFGWVKQLTKKGKSIYAELGDLAPEFVEWTQKGLYKKRSISLYPNSMKLRHVGFLGAMPPAVKGLEDIQFSTDEQAMTIEFDLPSGTEQSSNHEEFSELEATRSELAGYKKKVRRQEFRDFTEQLIDEGRLLPAVQERTIDLMESMDQAASFEFSEFCDMPKTESPLQAFQELLSKMPIVVSFGEFATSDNVDPSLKEAGSLTAGEQDVCSRFGISQEAYARAASKKVERQR